MNSVNTNKLSYMIKRYIYILCFTFFCYLDHIIGSADGNIQYGLKNYIGVLLGVIVLTAYPLRDYLKLPYLIWIVLYLIGAIFAKNWADTQVLNHLEFQTNLIGIGIYGVIVIRMFILYAIERHKPHMNWKPFIIWIIMMIAMTFIRPSFGWVIASLIAFLCFYLTDFKETDLNNLYLGMIDGIVLGFFLIQGQAWLYRPYDNVRYLGMYGHSSMNALFYLGIYCAILARWYYCKLKKYNCLYRGMYVLVMGIVIGTIFFTGSRTALISVGILTLTFLLFQILSRKKLKILEGIMDLIVIVVSVILLTYPAYCLIRYIPAYVNKPLYLITDNLEKKIQKDDPIDSEKYVELEEAMETMYKRWTWFIEEKNVSKLDVEKYFNYTLRVYASTWLEEYRLKNDDVYIEPGMDTYHPLLEGKDAYDATLVRLSIYKHFINRLQLIGEEGVPSGVWNTYGNYATHTHNLFLQMAYDFGIIVGVVFIILIIMFYNRITFALMDYKSGASYFRLCVSTLFMTAFVTFGMLDIDWIYGQLSFTMFFVVQYALFHKFPEEIRAESLEAKAAEVEVQSYEGIAPTESVADDELEYVDLDEE